ncbi:hypothetical protein MUP01_04940 [Candidatus Bathyarchaeota archaeon]|nr:hypothetical protein [Candidatus Bathyarchaeota archaeon]
MPDRWVVPFLTFLLLSLVGITSSVPTVHSSQEALLTVTPSCSTVQVGDCFWVNVSIENAPDLYAWQFKLCWRAYAFLVAEACYPDDYVFAGRNDATAFDPVIMNDSSCITSGENRSDWPKKSYLPGVPENNSGYALCGASLLGSAQAFNGNGVLASVKLVANLPGNWRLTLDSIDTTLLDSDLNILPCTRKTYSVVVEPYDVPEATLYTDPISPFMDNPELVSESYSFLMDVGVSNVCGLHAWQIGLLYNSSVLKCLERDADNLHGYFSWQRSMSQDQALNGNLTLRSILFQVVGIGYVGLRFDTDYTSLWLPDFSEIKYTVETGETDVGDYLFFNVHYSDLNLPPPLEGFFIYPRCSHASAGQTFTLAVCSSLRGYAGQAIVYFNSSVLRAERAWGRTGAKYFVEYIDNSCGYVLVGEAIPNRYYDCFCNDSSPWILGYVEFSLLRNDGCALNFARGDGDSFIFDWDCNEIPTNFTSGYVNPSACFDNFTIGISVVKHSGSYWNITEYGAALCSTSRHTVSSVSLDPIGKNIRFDTLPSLRADATVDSASFTAPKDLLGRDLEVLIDGEPVECLKWENETHTFLNFTFSHSPHTIVIKPSSTRHFEFVKGGETLQACLSTNSTIESLTYDENASEITINATGPSGTSGYCNITLPKSALSEPFAVSVNDTITPYTISEDPRHIFIYLEYGHSANTIRIMSTILGDITGDRKVDVRDVSFAARAFGACSDDSRWMPQADINRDNKIDVKDIAGIAKKFGWVGYPGYP